MIEIPEIKIRSIDIPQWTFNDPSQSLPYEPPVTVNIGVPIIDIPGCVEAHESNNGSKTINSDDENGIITYCDSGIPSYNPINFEPEQIIPTKPSGVDTRQPKSPETPSLEIPKTPPPPTTVKVDCPTEVQAAKEPVGTHIQGFRKKVINYKLVGNQCIQITEKVPIPEQIIAGLPSPGAVMTTGSIAVVATASALIAKPIVDVLLKVIKPMVKKVMKKITKIRGKQEEILSVTERRDLQRERTEAIRTLKKVLKPKG
jgi:hypothetical protein